MAEAEAEPLAISVMLFRKIARIHMAKCQHIIKLAVEYMGVFVLSSTLLSMFEIFCFLKSEKLTITHLVNGKTGI